MEEEEINTLCQQCYYINECPQLSFVQIIQCKKFKTVELQRNLFVAGKGKAVK